MPTSADPRATSMAAMRPGGPQGAVIRGIERETRTFRGIEHFQRVARRKISPLPQGQLGRRIPRRRPAPNSAPAPASPVRYEILVISSSDRTMFQDSTDFTFSKLNLNNRSARSE